MTRVAVVTGSEAASGADVQVSRHVRQLCDEDLLEDSFPTAQCWRLPQGQVRASHKGKGNATSIYACALDSSCSAAACCFVV